MNYASVSFDFSLRKQIVLKSNFVNTLVTQYSSQNFLKIIKKHVFPFTTQIKYQSSAWAKCNRIAKKLSWKCNGANQIWDKLFMSLKNFLSIDQFGDEWRLSECFISLRFINNDYIQKLYQYQMRTGWKHKNKSWENNHVYNISRWTKCYLLRKSMDLGGHMVKVLDLWQQSYHWPGFVPLYPLQVLMLPGLLYHCI